MKNSNNFLKNKKKRDCVFSSLGCEANLITDDDYYNHKLQYHDIHMSLLINKMDEIIEQNKEIRKENHRIEKILSNLQAFHSYPIKIKNKSKYLNNEDNEKNINKRNNEHKLIQKKSKKKKEDNNEKEELENENFLEKERNEQTFENNSNDFNLFKKNDKIIENQNENVILITSDKESDNDNNFPKS